MKQSKTILQLLRDYESPNVTFIENDGSWPIVWERARGMHVWDADGRKYLDLTAAFGVAAAGHANPHVIAAGCSQMKRLLHAMGDVHPHPLKGQLARELSRLTFGRWFSKSASPERRTGKTIFCNSGFESVEAAFKTAMLATGRRGVIAFTGAYHGLGYGALNATHRDHFRTSFRSQLREFAYFAPFPSAPKDLVETESVIQQFFRHTKIGAILVEPIQVRAGINIPPPDFLPMLRRLCDAHGALLILDEIYTGFGRTGKWFACEHSGAIPDLICLGKALTGGFPLSACVGRADVMDRAWPVSNGEAIHTSTFLGHPVGCAMALAEIQEIRRLDLVRQSEQMGKLLQQELQAAASEIPWRRFQSSVRAMGLLAGLELVRHNGIPATVESLRIIKNLLRNGFIVLPEGEHSNIISMTPPLTITKQQVRQAGAALVSAIREELSGNEAVALEQPAAAS